MAWINKMMREIAKSLGLLQDTMTRLTVQRDEAAAKLAKAEASMDGLLGSADSRDHARIDELEREIGGKLVTIKRLDKKIEDHAALIVAEENRLADNETKKQNATAADVMIADETEIDSDLKVLFPMVRSVATKLQKYATHRVPFAGMSEFSFDFVRQLEWAWSVEGPGLLDSAEAVREGRERAPSQPAPIVKLVTSAPAKTETIFFLRAAKWVDEKGTLHLIQQCEDATLPTALAKEVLARTDGVAVPRSDPRRKATQGAWSDRPVRAVNCIALNPAAATEVSNVKSMQPGNPQPHPNLRPEYKLIVPTQPAMANTRAMPTKK